MCCTPDYCECARRYSGHSEMLYAELDAVIAAGYDTALGGSWSAVASRRCRVAFQCHFADVFARTTRLRGVCRALSRPRCWRLPGPCSSTPGSRRNVWSTRHPTRLPGEIVTTRDMMEPSALMREQMFADYLAPRGLHEGLRLTLAAQGGWVQDISLLRSWSGGPFTALEREAGGGGAAASAAGDRASSPGCRRPRARRLRRVGAGSRAWCWTGRGGCWSRMRRPSGCLRAGTG